jgi:hypothetical protein
MKLERIPYAGWRRNVRLSNGAVELVVTLDVGPRIIHFGFRGGANVFGQFPEDLGRAGERRWKLRGGHRLWIAPERKPHTYEPDNGPLAFDEIPGGIRTLEKPGRLTGIQRSLEIRLAPRGARVRVAHVLSNRGRRPVECAAWALSVMPARCTAIMPLPEIVPHDSRVSPNQNWSLWRYTDLGDPRLRLSSRWVTLRQDPRRGPIKLGMAEREGWAAGLLDDGHLLVKLFRRAKGRAYPDGDVNFEVYSDERILELETLGPLVTLKPGQSLRHEEEWVLFGGVPRARTANDVARHVMPLVRRALG